MHHLNQVRTQGLVSPDPDDVAGGLVAYRVRHEASYTSNNQT